MKIAGIDLDSYQGRDDDVLSIKLTVKCEEEYKEEVYTLLMVCMQQICIACRNNEGTVK